MPLKAYKRRHSPECLERLERRIAKGMKRPENLDEYPCHTCAWWVRGTTDYGKHIPRHSLKVFTWEAACSELARLNRHDEKTRVRIADAKEQWLAELRTAKLAESTLTAYDLAVRTLIEFMTAHHVEFLGDIKPLLLNQMRAGWTTGTNTHQTYRTQVSTFLNFCVRMEWLDFNPMQKTRRVERRLRTAADEATDDVDGEANATMPLDLESDANYRKVCASLAPYLRNELVRPEKSRQRARRGILCRHPENFLALLHLMYETGLRISDAVFFDLLKMEVDEHGGIYTTIQIKTRTPVTVFLDSWLVEEIQQLPKLARGRYPFWNGSRNWKGYINNNVRPALRELGECIGIEGSLRPHRFRDSFAVNRLNEGMTMDELRLLLGHANVAMTERYYAPFIKSRAVSLRARYRATREAYRDHKVVPITHRTG